MRGKKLSKGFYAQTDVIAVSKSLLGKLLITDLHGVRTSGIITETEAYRGVNDKASHAYANRLTKRTQVFYGEGGFAYVYLCYGIHHLFNVITNKANAADAVLIRAIEPIEGISTMLERRGFELVNRKLTGGPGALSKALGINMLHYGMDLTGDSIWIEEYQNINETDIIASPRVGINYAEEDALLPWRFRIKDNPFTSPAK